MATIYKDYGSGGAGLTSLAGISGGSGSQRHPAIAKVLRDVADDLATVKATVNDLRTAYNATLAKLDADITAGGSASETNYAATNPAPAAIGTLLTIKG